MLQGKNYIFNLLNTILISMLIGAILMLILGYNPIEAYYHLFRGAFVGKLSLGTTLEKFVPLLLTSLAFVISAKVGVFNIGVEGELYLGAITAAWIGVLFDGLFGPLHILLCFLGAMLVGALWAAIPAILKVTWKANEICVTILLNYVAIYITSYLVNGPLSAGAGVAKTHDVSENVLLHQFMYPSRANFGLFIAIAVFVFMLWLLTRTTLGYKIKTVGLNPNHADYAGISSKQIIIKGMLISGAVGGIAGAIEVLGIFGYFLDGFSPAGAGLAFDGLLAALIVKCDLRLIPFITFFLAGLKSGGLGMERYTGVPKSIVDTIVAIFIIIACIDTLFFYFKDKVQGFYKRRIVPYNKTDVKT